MTFQIPTSPIVVALDVASRVDALNLAQQLDPAVCRLKVGKELFTAVGPQIVEDLHRLGFAVFLDLKFHDIPVTVAKAVKAAANLGVWMVNVHASGGIRMLAAAAESVVNVSHKPLLIAVTLLTSFSEDDFLSIGGREGQMEEQIIRLARLAYTTGLDGVVCSAQEVRYLKQQTSSAFIAVTPGIRPVDAESNDQSRIMTPESAVQQGSDYLVIGRPITQSSDPARACAVIAQNIAVRRLV